MSEEAIGTIPYSFFGVAKAN